MVYAVGIDSGGTHSTIRMAEPDGTERAVAEIENSLASNHSDAELLTTFGKIFSAIRGRLSDSPVAAWISCAGYSASTRDRYERLLRTSMDGSAGRFGMCNDAVGLLLAHDPGVVTVIAGTGSVVMARTADGDVISLGGDEWVAADYGSAFWTGLLGIRAAYRSVEGGPETALLHSLVERYNPLPGSDRSHDTKGQVKDIVRRLAGQGTRTKTVVAQFAASVTRQAELGDEVAQTIVKSGAEELAAIAARVYRQLAEQARPAVQQPRFVLNGGLGYRSSFYSEAFRAALNQLLFDVRGSLGADTVELGVQLNGTAEALSLARLLAADQDLPVLKDHNAYSILAS